MGTTPYMSPERLRGTVTQKADIYSFGIVLLELLTGLQSLVKGDKEIVNIQDHVAAKGGILETLDPIIEKWCKAQDIYDLAKKCLVYEHVQRPNMEQVCECLAKISAEFDESAKEV
jgi:interleukin-1 receptor-associated kinase 4